MRTISLSFGAALSLLVSSATGVQTQSKGAPPAGQTARPTSVADGPVPYTIVEEWVIPQRQFGGNGGRGRLVVISPTYRNERSLRQLGGQLVALSANDWMASASVYDSHKAADMYHNMPEGDDARGRFYDKHFLASYDKNGNSGVNELTIMPQGLGGPRITVNY